MNAFSRLVSPGTSKETGRLFLEINYRGRRLSISGVEGPKPNGDARGSCGQCVDALSRLDAFDTGWDAERCARLRDLWQRWHLNDMRPGCEHQRDWDTTRTVELVSYKLTTEACTQRQKAIAHAARCAANGVQADLSATERALVLLDDWFRTRHAPPDADDPLSGCFDVEKREQKALGWLRADEHPDGMLSRPCPTCGYKYGSAWVFEEIPLAVLQELADLPETENLYPWTRRSA